MAATNNRNESFRELYVRAQRLCRQGDQDGDLAKYDEALVQLKAIKALFPLPFPEDADQLIVNFEVDDGEPVDGATDTMVLYETTCAFFLDDWRCKITHHMGQNHPDEAVKGEAQKEALALAHSNLTELMNRPGWASSFKSQLEFYANMIGWHAFIQVDDPQKLEEALGLVDEARTKVWGHQTPLTDTRVRLLFKLDKQDQAFDLVQEVLGKDPDFADLQDVKESSAYRDWLTALEKQKQEQERALQERIRVEQDRIKDQTHHPDHPCVKKHLESIQALKRGLVAARIKALAHGASEDDYAWGPPLSPDQADGLLDALTAFLLEIGELGEGFFESDGVTLPDDEELEEGLLYLGYSRAHHEIYLVCKGEHAGQVWVEIDGAKRIAAKRHPNLLDFLTASLERRTAKDFALPGDSDWDNYLL